MIIDALDEAATTRDVRAIIDEVVLPLAETCADIGANMVIGTRRDDAGELLGRFSSALAVLDLDEPEYFAEEDLADYALACLRLEGDERLGNPYDDEDAALLFANRIAAISGGNFLIAGLVARAHGMHDEQSASPGLPDVPADRGLGPGGLPVTAQPRRPLARQPRPHGAGVRRAPGLPVNLWQAAIHALYGTRPREADLVLFARSAAANFLIESGGDDGGSADEASQRVYRLFSTRPSMTLCSAHART